MACGCPVIASDAASLPEIVEDGRSGRVVKPGDTQGFRAAAGEFASDRERWSRLAEHSRWIVETRFTWARVAGRCMDAYRGANETSAAA
jgi:glycosyltransferase involved in cell wall biosynthesis